MRGAFCAFNGLVQALLVRHGAEERLPKGGHIFDTVYTEMLLQVTREYPGLPDARTLKAREIRFFYDGLRGELKRHTTPKG
jgi:hypothetical protein